MKYHKNHKNLLLCHEPLTSKKVKFARTLLYLICFFKQLCFSFVKYILKFEYLLLQNNSTAFNFYYSLHFN